MEKLPERAPIKVTSVASSAGTRSVRLMTEALDGKFEGHRAQETRILRHHIDALDKGISHPEVLAG